MVLYDIDSSLESINIGLLLYIFDKYVEPVENDFYGTEYHVSVFLKDETYLPCVVFRHLKKVENIFYNELHEVFYLGTIHKRQMNQEDVQRRVINDLLNNNNVNLSDIKRIESCKYSFPKNFLDKLTFMPTHFFLAKFKDVSYENFRYNSESFFELPENKTFKDIIEVYDSKLLLTNGNILDLKNLSDWMTNKQNFKKIHVNKPNFQCYLSLQMDAKDFEDELIRIRKNYT